MPFPTLTGNILLFATGAPELDAVLTPAPPSLDALGPAGIAFDREALHAGGLPPLGPDDAGGILKDHFYNRAATIFGGASEIQRNIIAKAVLGL